jgi:hypothetical protein
MKPRRLVVYLPMQVESALRGWAEGRSLSPSMAVRALVKEGLGVDDEGRRPNGRMWFEGERPC